MDIAKLHFLDTFGLDSLKVTVYRSTKGYCRYLFGHILSIFQRNDYGKTIWVLKTCHGHQKMVIYPLITWNEGTVESTRQIFLCVAETHTIFRLFHTFLWCSFTNNACSRGINERNQNNRGAKALRILIFLRRSKMQLSVTSSYIQKCISPGLVYF